MQSNFLKRILSKIYQKYAFKLPNKSYSQEGEDLILKRFFEDRTTGFYVDIGAYHPTRFSNTYLFYKKGWRGINIEPRPGSKKLFDRVRKRDINIEAAVSDEEKELVYYRFNEPALNGFSKNISMERDKLEKFKIIDEIKITTTALTKILENYLPPETRIDFMSVDVEGFDFKVLKSNNWIKYRPQFILTEDLNFNLQFPGKSDAFNFMKEKNYELIAKTYNTLFFKDVS
jgi:FkbM family methyltransferase